MRSNVFIKYDKRLTSIFLIKIAQLRKGYNESAKVNLLEELAFRGSYCKQKSPAICRTFWVIEGARTPDPQNHNLML